METCCRALGLCRPACAHQRQATLHAPPHNRSMRMLTRGSSSNRLNCLPRKCHQLKVEHLHQLQQRLQCSLHQRRGLCQQQPVGISQLCRMRQMHCH